MTIRIACLNVCVCNLECSGALTASGRGTVGAPFATVMTFGASTRARTARLAGRRPVSTRRARLRDGHTEQACMAHWARRAAINRSEVGGVRVGARGARDCDGGTAWTLQTAGAKPNVSDWCDTCTYQDRMRSAHMLQACTAVAVSSSQDRDFPQGCAARQLGRHGMRVWESRGDGE